MEEVKRFVQECLPTLTTEDIYLIMETFFYLGVESFEDLQFIEPEKDLSSVLKLVQARKLKMKIDARFSHQQQQENKNELEDDVEMTKCFEQKDQDTCRAPASKNMEELIRQGLPGVDEDIIINVITHLKNLGMIFAEDCQYVEEDFLIDVLSPILVKKLLSFFKKFCSDTLDQPQVVNAIEFKKRGNEIVSRHPVPLFSSDVSTITSPLNSSSEFTIDPKKNLAEDSDTLDQPQVVNAIEFKERGNEIVSRYPVPLFSSDESTITPPLNSSSEFTIDPQKNLAEDSDTLDQPQAVNVIEFKKRGNEIVSRYPVPLFSSDVSTITSPLNSSSEFTIDPKKNWAEDFVIPWSLFPKEALNTAERGKPLRKSLYTLLIKILSDFIVRVNPSPGRKNIKIIAKKIVAKYPETFQDRVGDSVAAGGCINLMKKIEIYLDNRKRKNISDLFESTFEGQKIRKTNRNSYGCNNWQPIELPVGETKSIQLEHKIWLKNESTKLIREEDRINELMIKSYASQRYFINSKNPIDVIKEEWPILFENKHFINHASILLGKESICDTICNNMTVKGKLIFDFMRCKNNKSQSVFDCLVSIETAKTIQDSNSSEVVGSILLILAYFCEKEDELFQINTDRVTTEDLEANPGRHTPFIATSGGDIFSANEYFIVIDGTVVLKTEEFKMAVALLIMSFFVFNKEYPVKVAFTLEFIQRVFADINPQRGNKVSTKVHHSFSKKILRFANALNVFERHFNL